MEKKKRPRGRPATGRVRKSTLGLRLTEEEKSALLERSKAHGMTLASYFLAVSNFFEKKTKKT